MIRNRRVLVQVCQIENILAYNPHMLHQVTGSSMKSSTIKQRLSVIQNIDDKIKKDYAKKFGSLSIGFEQGSIIEEKSQFAQKQKSFNAVNYIHNHDRLPPVMSVYYKFKERHTLSSNNYMTAKSR